MDNADVALVVSIVSAVIALIALGVSIASAKYAGRAAAAATAPAHRRRAQCRSRRDHAENRRRRSRRRAGVLRRHASGARRGDRPALYLVTDFQNNVLWLGEYDVLYGHLENRGPSPAVLHDVELDSHGGTLWPQLTYPMRVEPSTPLELRFDAAGDLRWIDGPDHPHGPRRRDRHDLPGRRDLRAAAERLERPQRSAVAAREHPDRAHRVSMRTPDRRDVRCSPAIGVVLRRKRRAL